MDSDAIAVKVNITPDFYHDRGCFWRKMNYLTQLYGASASSLVVLVSYQYYKPEITSVQVSHYKEALRVFPSIRVIHASGVKWNGYDAELKGMGICIFDGDHEGGVP